MSMMSDFGKEVSYQDAINIVKKYRRQFLDIYDGDKWVKRGEVESFLDDIIEDIQKELNEV